MPKVGGVDVRGGQDRLVGVLAGSRDVVVMGEDVDLGGCRGGDEREQDQRGKEARQNWRASRGRTSSETCHRYTRESFITEMSP